MSGIVIFVRGSSPDGSLRKLSTPSVAELLGVPCVCAQLDVLAVKVSDEEILGS